MSNYTRQSSFSDGDVITSALFNNEYNQLLSAFAYASSGTTGHQHDGGAGEGGNIHTIGDQNFLNKIVVDSTNNRWGFFVEVSSSTVEQIRLQDGALVPVTDNDIDLGTSSLEFKDGYFDGTVYADAINFNGTAITATAAELNIMDGVTSTAAELNILDGVTASATDINLIDGITNGTVIASKVIITDANKDISGGRNITISGELDAATLDISGDADIDGTTNLDAVDIDGTVQIDGVTTFGVDDTGVDVKFFGATSGAYLLWDESADKLLTAGATTIDIVKDKLLIGSTAVTTTAAELNILDGVTSTTAELNILDGVTSTAAELNILDGVTSTAAELNILDGVTSTAAELNILDGVTTTAAEINLIDGDTSRGTTAVASGDGILINDAGTMRMTNVDTVSTYFSSHNVGGGNIVTTGALNSGSITSGFGAIDNGSSNISTTGTVTFGSITDGTITATAFVDEDDMSSDSATLIPTQQSVKAYVDGQDFAATSFVMEDGDGTEVTITKNKEMKFVEGGGIDINWTDTDNGTDGDPYDLTFTINAAQTDITSLLATDIKIGEDDQTKIDFETADEIHFYAANAHQIKLVDGALVPVTDNDIDLGTSSLEFKDAYFDGTVTSDAFAGPLTGNVTGNVSGTAATVTGAAQSSITSLGTLTTLTVDNVVINGATIGHGDDTDLMTVADGVLTVAGEVSMTTLDIGGTNVTSTAAELNILDGVTSTAAELNILDGVTSTTAELNILDGVTSTAAELNILDGVTSTAAELNILDGVTSTAAELNILDGVTSTATELNLLDGSSPGSVVNSKAVIYSSGGVVNATDVAVSGSGNRSISITSSNGIASMEIGAAASNAAFIDFKTPSSDDFDMRVSSASGGSGGFLQVASGNFNITGSGKTSAVFDGDGAVTLYHNNVAKLATTSGGVQIDGTTTDDCLVIKTTEAGASTAPDVVLYRLSSSPADNDFIGKFEFRGRNDNTQDVQYSFIATQATDVSDGTEDGRLLLSTKVAGSDKTHVTLDADGIKLDGNVGIGTTAPTTYANSMGNTLVVGTGNNFAVIQGRTDGASGSTNGVNYGGSYGTNPINGARMVLAAAGGAGQRGLITFNTKNTDDDTNQPTERVRIAADGKVGIGTSAPETNLHVFKASSGASTDSSAVVHIENSGTTLLQLSAGTSNDCHIAFGDSGNQNIGSIAYANNGNHMAFRTDNAERMRMLSDGQLIVAGTSFNANGSVCIGPIGTSSNGCTAVSASTSATNIWRFYNPNGQVGGISISGSATTFATSSDYRLKENVNYTFDATTRLKQLKPARFNFKSDADTTVDGFLAHEVSSIVPEAVAGTKDAVDENGDAVYQGIDQSKLVPLLVKTIQELEARITALEAG